MSRRPTAQISIELLESLFEEFDLWPKIRDGRLVSEPLPKKARPSWQWPNATSSIVKHRLATGKHVATTHRIEAANGGILHEDAKDLLLGDVCLWRF